MAYYGGEFKDTANNQQFWKIIKKTNGDLMTGRKRTNKTKARIMIPKWWPGMEN